MRISRYLLLTLVLLGGAVSCTKDEPLYTDQGPELTRVEVDQKGVYGGKIRFSAQVNDRLPLSTLKAQVFFDDEIVSEEVIRTKTDGTYNGEVAIPYFKNFPEKGHARIVLVAQNIKFGLTRSETPIEVGYPAPEKLFFETDGKKYEMNPTKEPFEYAVTGDFPQKPAGYFTTSPIDGSGTTLTFGYDSSSAEVRVGSTEPLPIANLKAGEYTVKFNLRTFAYAPVLELMFNGVEMQMGEGDKYSVVTNLDQESVCSFEGVGDLSSWTVDRDFFDVTDAALGRMKFLPLGGLYKVTADAGHNYLKCEAMKSEQETGILNSDATGQAVWVIGDASIGKPTTANGASWNPEQGGLCMARIGEKKYQITLTAGVSLNPSAIDFKFFWQKTWDHGEFYGKTPADANRIHGLITTDSPLVSVTKDGNIRLQAGKSFDKGGVYRFTVDLAGGVMAAKLLVEKIGEEQLPAADIRINGQQMTQVDAENYRLDLDLEQATYLTWSGKDAFEPVWIDTNYFAPEGEAIRFIPVSGRYRIEANTAQKAIVCHRIKDDGSPASINPDGSGGGLWIMGWGIGLPNQDYQPGWTPEKAYGMAEFEPRKFRLVGKAGPEKGSVPGDYFRADYLDFKYFYQKGWGGEMKNPAFLEGEASLLKRDGNLKLNGVTLETGATYELIIDLSKGCDKEVISFKKK